MTSSTGGARLLAPVLVLTGGPAAGKTTTARALAGSMDRCAVVDVDDLRQLVVSGHAAPWDGEDGRRQQVLGVRNACRLARAFVEDGFDVVVADVLTPDTAELYRAELADLVIVHLVLARGEARLRASGRPAHLAADEFERLHQDQLSDPPPADARLDVTRMTPSQQAERVRSLWLARSGAESAERPAPPGGGADRS